MHANASAGGDEKVAVMHPIGAKIALAIEEITKVLVDVRTPGDLSESFRAKVMAEAQPI
jgi:hypothetical protein